MMAHPIVHVVEAFPKLSESFISNKLLWIQAQGIPTWVIDKFPAQREYAYFPEEIQKTFKALSTGLYPGNNTLQRTLNRCLTVLNAWGYSLPRHPLILREFQRQQNHVPLRLTPPWPFAVPKQDVQQRIDHFLTLYHALRLTPRCVHVHFGFNALDWIPAKRVLGDKLRLVVSFLGGDLTLHPQAHPGLYAELFEVGDDFLASSPYLRDLAVGYGCPPEKIHIHPVEIDTDFFAPNADPNEEGAPLRILSVGRLVWEKDYDTALRAMAHLKALLPDIPFTYDIVGDGPLKESLQRHVKTLRLEGIVTFHGNQSQAWVRDRLRQSDLFLLTSVSEGLGSALLEASACGLPVVATRVGGIPFAVQDTVTGLLVAPQNPEAITASLQALLQDGSLRHTMGHAGRRYVEAHFAAKILYSNLLEHYGL